MVEQDRRETQESCDAEWKQQSLMPADKVVIAYLLLIAALILIFRSRVLGWWLLLPAHGAAIGLILLLSRPRGNHRLHSSPLASTARNSSSPEAPPSRSLIPSFIRAWYPVLLIPFTYKELEYLIPRIHPYDFDNELAAIDFLIFGVHPTVWLERITLPLLTELLQLSYITYYFLPIVLGTVLWRKRRYGEFYFLVFVFVLGFYLSYLGYITVPALGPRFLSEIRDAQTKPLTGILLFDVVHRTLNRLEGITRDCFPSGHTELTLLVLYYARKFHRATFWSLLPAGSMLILSTVYLRYHYVVDVVAGAALALLIIATARPAYRGLGG
jgi:membrane-associated phospholipid phosphatase